MPRPQDSRVPSLRAARDAKIAIGTHTTAVMRTHLTSSPMSRVYRTGHERRSF